MADDGLRTFASHRDDERSAPTIAAINGEVSDTSARRPAGLADDA